MEATALPPTMTVIAISGPGGPRMLRPETRALPQPAENEVLIRVRAAGVNRPDVAQRQGSYPPPPGASDLPGLEVAGEIVAQGARSNRWQIGDKVAALTPGGGYAEYVAVHETNVLPMPTGFAFTEAIASLNPGDIISLEAANGALILEPGAYLSVIQIG